MENLRESLSEMMALFQNRMTNFEAELHKTPSDSSSSTAQHNLTADFTSFKKFILESLSCLQMQMEVLAQGLDALEMRGRRKILLIHGVTEQAKEETDSVIANVVQNQLKIANFTTTNIRRCHRMGRQADASKPRPILVKLADVGLRDDIWFAKTKLKGSGVTLSEFLTKSRHRVFMAAREKFGVSKCWTRQGHIYILGSDGSRHRIVSLSDLNAIQPDTNGSSASSELECLPAHAAISSPVRVQSPVPKKSKRAVRK